MKPLANLALALTTIITLLAVALPAMADDNQLSPSIEDQCKNWTRDSDNWRQCISDQLEARQKALDAQIAASAKEIARERSARDLAAKKVHLMRVDCSLIQGTQRIWLVAGPRLSAGRVAEVKCGEEVIARSNQDGWTKVLKQIGESPQGVEGYISSSLLVEIPLPDLPDDPPKIRLAAAPPTGFQGEAYHVGNGVSAPRAVETPDPDYTEEARKARIEGTVLLWLIVGVDGHTSNIRVIHSLDKSLDQSAVETVSRWLFVPAMKDGVPVAVQINVEVKFRLLGEPITNQLSPAPSADTTKTANRVASRTFADDKYPLEVVVKASRTLYETYGNRVEIAIQIGEGTARKSYTIGCDTAASACRLLLAGTYPARWRKGKLEVVSHDLDGQKSHISQYGIVAENDGTK